MDWNGIGTTVARVAPLLGAALGGPVGAVASAAGALLGSALGVAPEPASVAAALGDPQALATLRELEVRERARLLDWQAEQLRAELDNTRDARAREVALARAGHGGAWVTGLVALVVVAGFFGMLRVVLEQPSVSEPALLLLGSLGTAFGAVVNYYLGSSLGSFRKDELRSRAGEGAPR